MKKHELYDFLEENDVKFVRLSFCDLLGKAYNVSVMANEVPRIFHEGQPIDISMLQGFSKRNVEDVWLHPDMDSLSLLPWRPHTNAVMRFYCDMKDNNGDPAWVDARQLLKQSVERLKALGFTCEIGTNCEFYLCKTDEQGEPTLSPLDQGGYLDIAPLDKGENIRREICLCLEEMGFKPERSYHEQGPGQNEIDFMFSSPLTAADNFLTFKSVVKSIATQNGLFASFMPKPFLDKPGNALQVNLSLMKDGINLFTDRNSPSYHYAQSFVAGILEKIPEMMLFLNPLDNSYERIGSFDAPKSIGWSSDNQGQLVKLPKNRNEKACMELRSADPTVNPYLAFALLLQAGIYGIEQALPLQDAFLEEDTAVSLPKTMGEAVENATNSEFIHSVLSAEMVTCYTQRCHHSLTCSKEEREKAYQAHYFASL